MVSHDTSIDQLPHPLVSKEKLKARQNSWAHLFASFETTSENTEDLDFDNIVDAFGRRQRREKKEVCKDKGASSYDDAGAQCKAKYCRKRGRPRKDLKLNLEAELADSAVRRKRGRPRLSQTVPEAKAGADVKTENILDDLNRKLGSSTQKRRGRPRLDVPTDVIHTSCLNKVDMNQPGLTENRIRLRTTKRSCSKTKSSRTDETDTTSKDNKKNSCGALSKSRNVDVDLTVFTTNTTKYMVEETLKSDLSFKLFKRYESSKSDRVNKEFVFWNDQVTKELDKLLKVISADQLDKYMVESLNSWILMVKESVVDVKLKKKEKDAGN